MKNIIALLMGLALGGLTGCAAPPAVSLEGAAKAGPNIVATLARTGTCEMDVASDFTALASYRTRTARLLETKAITIDQAIKVQALADSARADLDAACPDVSARLNVLRRDSARTTLKSIASMLEKKP
jgi:hypothetical protein